MLTSRGDRDALVVDRGERQIAAHPVVAGRERARAPLLGEMRIGGDADALVVGERHGDHRFPRAEGGGLAEEAEASRQLLGAARGWKCGDIVVEAGAAADEGGALAPNPLQIGRPGDADAAFVHVGERRHRVDIAEGGGLPEVARRLERVGGDATPVAEDLADQLGSILVAERGGRRSEVRPASTFRVVPAPSR